MEHTALVTKRAVPFWLQHLQDRLLNKSVEGGEYAEFVFPAIRPRGGHALNRARVYADRL